MPDEVKPQGPISLNALFVRFLRLGALAWGGPVAQIGMIKRELVDEEGWVSPQRFNRLLAIYQVLPGPEAHELCVHLGMTKRGRLGGIVAGLGFMLPGFLLILLLAWMYAQIDLTADPLAAIFLGVQAGVIAIIVRAVHRIGGHALVDRWLWAVAIIVAAASFAGVPFWVTLPAAGLAYALLKAGLTTAGIGVVVAAGVLAALTVPAGLAPTPMTGQQNAVASGTVSAMALFVTGLKAGMLTFGGAYTAIPFVHDDVVGRGWLSEGQFIDSLALSGIIPAPLIIFATFVGFQAGGLAGALAITAGMFLPAFAFALLFYDRLERIVDNERLHHFLEGVAAGVVGLIAVTTIELGSAVARSVPSLIPALLIFAAGLASLYRSRSKLAIPAVVIGSALAGGFLFDDLFGWLAAFSLAHGG